MPAKKGRSAIDANATGAPSSAASSAAPASETRGESEAVSTTPEPEVKRWTEGDPQTREYYYDEELPKKKLIKSTRSACLLLTMPTQM